MTIDDLDRLYEIVGDELRAGNLQSGLWARAIAEGSGNDSRAQSIYVSYRVAELRERARAAAAMASATAAAASAAEKAEERARLFAQLLRNHPLPEVVATLLGTPCFAKRFATVHSEWNLCSVAALVDLVLAWDDSDAFYRAAHYLHYEELEFENAIPIYEFIRARFPDAPEGQYSLTQLENIQSMTEDQRQSLRMRRAGSKAPSSSTLGE